jgi:transcriptional regulator with XRE-family HTH domain
MPTVVRLAALGRRKATRQLAQIGEDLRNRRLELGLSQREVAQAAGKGRSRLTRVEAGSVETLGILELAQFATALGLDSVVRLYPGGIPLRDAGQARRLAMLLGWVRNPLAARIEVGLPAVPDHSEQRAWDAVLFGSGERTSIEVEMQLRDVQAMRRRHDLKRRDDPTEHFLLAIAGSRHNRRVVAELPELFADLPRLRFNAVRAALQAGCHPPTGMLFV